MLLGAATVVLGVFNVVIMEACSAAGGGGVVNETTASALPLAAVLVPAGAAVLAALTGRWPNLRDTWATLAGIAMVVIAVLMLADTLDGRIHRTVLLELSLGIDSPDIELALRADPAGMIFGLLVSVLWVLAGIYAVGYMRGEHEQKQTRFFARVRAQHRNGGRRGARGEPADVRPLLRTALALHVPTGDAPRDGDRAGRRSEVPGVHALRRA